MTTVTMTADQAEALVKTGELVELLNPDGAVLGYFAPVKVEFAEQYAAMAARASTRQFERRWYTGEEVRAHLKALEEQGL